MNYEIVELNEKTAAVLTAKTNNFSPEMGETIGGLWKRFYSKEIISALINRADNYTLGIYTDYSSDEKSDYTAAVGCAVKSSNDIPNEMKVITIPAGKYAVFSLTGEMDTAAQLEKIRQIWQEIWNMKLPRSYICDFEEYRGNDLNKANVHIYIGLKGEK